MSAMGQEVVGRQEVVGKHKRSLDVKCEDCDNGQLSVREGSDGEEFVFCSSCGVLSYVPNSVKIKSPAWKRGRKNHNDNDYN